MRWGVMYRTDTHALDDKLRTAAAKSSILSRPQAVSKHAGWRLEDKAACTLGRHEHDAAPWTRLRTGFNTRPHWPRQLSFGELGTRFWMLSFAGCVDGHWW